MPQLDFATFLSQFIWLVISFLGFYFLLVKFYLPRVARAKKVRDRTSERRSDLPSETSESTADASVHSQSYAPKAPSDGEFARGTKQRVEDVTTKSWQQSKKWMEDVFTTEKPSYQNQYESYFAHKLTTQKKILLFLIVLLRPHRLGRQSARINMLLASLASRVFAGSRGGGMQQSASAKHALNADANASSNKGNRGKSSRASAQKNKSAVK